jgi:hypothetical protein
MRTIRRFYFYLVAFISLEVVVWGAISLARTLFENLPGGNSNQLATGLSLVLVGAPIFLLHWLIAQRDARRDEEEHASRLRVVFLYGARLATLIPVVQNVLALISRPLLSLLGSSANLALIGATQSVWDNLAAIAINLVAWAYFERALHADWQAALPGTMVAEVRRLYRFIWLLYSLVYAISGVLQLLRYLFDNVQALNRVEVAWLGNGLAWTLVGVPLWVYTWQSVQRLLDRPGGPGEQSSMLRMSVLYLLALTGVVVTLSSVGVVLAYMLRWVLGETQTLVDFLFFHNISLSTGITFAILWAYYGRILHREISLEPDPLRQAGLRRLYGYILALAGNGVTFFGVWWLLSVLVDLLFGNLTGGDLLRTRVSTGLAALLVGIPVWLSYWPRLQAEATLLTDQGEYARRSLVRKTYLYLALFLTVAGGMASAGALFFLVLNAVLGNPSADFWLSFFQRLQTLLVVLVWLLYHLEALRRDARFAQRALSERHASYPVLIFDNEAGAFASELAPILQRQMPRLPVAICRLGSAPLDEDLSAARLVVLPLDLATRPPEALRLWLENFSGRRILVPVADEKWVWLGTPLRTAGAAAMRELAQATAQAVRQVAEGQPVKPPMPNSPWVIAGYILAGLFGLEILLISFALVMSFVGG